MVPGADILTDIAAVEPVAELGVEFIGDGGGVLDREVGDTFPCVELIWGGDCAGGTGIEATTTGAAAIDGGFIGR